MEYAEEKLWGSLPGIETVYVYQGDVRAAYSQLVATAIFILQRPEAQGEQETL